MCVAVGQRCQLGTFGVVRCAPPLQRVLHPLALDEAPHVLRHGALCGASRVSRAAGRHTTCPSLHRLARPTCRFSPPTHRHQQPIWRQPVPLRRAWRPVHRTQDVAPNAAPGATHATRLRHDRGECARCEQRASCRSQDRGSGVARTATSARRSGHSLEAAASARKTQSSKASGSPGGR